MKLCIFPILACGLTTVGAELYTRVTADRSLHPEEVSTTVLEYYGGYYDDSDYEDIFEIDFSAPLKGERTQLVKRKHKYKTRKTKRKTKFKSSTTTSSSSSNNTTTSAAGAMNSAEYGVGSKLLYAMITISFVAALDICY